MFCLCGLFFNGVHKAVFVCAESCMHIFVFSLQWDTSLREKCSAFPLCSFKSNLMDSWLRAFIAYDIHHSRHETQPQVAFGKKKKKIWNNTLYCTCGCFGSGVCSREGLRRGLSCCGYSVLWLEGSVWVDIRQSLGASRGSSLVVYSNPPPHSSPPPPGGWLKVSGWCWTARQRWNRAQTSVSFRICMFHLPNVTPEMSLMRSFEKRETHQSWND